MEALAQACLWLVFGCGALVLSTVTVTCVVLAYRYVVLLNTPQRYGGPPIRQMDVPEPSHNLVTAPAPVVPAGVGCPCGRTIVTQPIKGEVVEGKSVLVYKCTCGKVVKV